MLECFQTIAQEVLQRRWAQQQQAQQQPQPRQLQPARVARAGLRRTATTGDAASALATPPATARQQRCLSADGRSRQPRFAAAAATAAGAPSGSGGGSAARASSASPSPYDWHQLLREYEIDDGQLAGGHRRPTEEQSCRII